VAVICSKKSEQADDYGCNLGILNGIFRESERYNVVVQVLPFSIKESSEDELFESLLDFDTKGVIWLTPQKNDWKKIDYLRMNNLPVIAARRWRVKNGGPCVETDFNTAGFETGEKFLENGCDNALIIDNSRRTSKFDDRAGRFVLSISEGLARSFSRSGDYSPEKIDVKSLDFQTPQTKSEICKLLTNIKPETGIVFADGGILLNLLEWDKEKFYKCLFDKQFAVLGFDLINSWIISEAKGLKFWILNEPLEALGRNAVQKVLSIHKGYLADTTTLVKVKLQFVNG
jgi:DNA-binding LacI/PurR family transcriptional regulator